MEVGEVFQIDKDPALNGYVFRFSNNDLQLSAANVDNDTWEVANNNRLLGLLYGSLSIRKLPWKPKIDEVYYIPRIHTDDSFMWTTVVWENNKADNKLYQLGIVCKTMEEAKAMTKKMIAAVAQEARNNG